MDTNCRNQENDDHYNMYGIRKTLYWDKFGVKRFLYLGKRRYTPLIYQNFDGGFTLSNDVFGLTIRQFEEMYKDCLDRRIKQEQWILNLRYPDKSLNEYLEYLNMCTDCNKDRLYWPGHDLKEKYLFEHLINAVGTEIEIRTRQRLFIIEDMIKNLSSPVITHISSGSLAEGLDLPGSDLDMMIILETVNVLRNERTYKNPIQNTSLVMETNADHPGFTRLKLLEKGTDESNLGNVLLNSSKDGSYVSVDAFMNNVKKIFKLSMIQFYSHGPCLSDKDQDFDITVCVQSKCFPYQALPWSFRHRHQWPPNNVIDKIIHLGCLIVPIGPRTLSGNHLLWRLSFSLAEKQLVHSFNITQLLCYGLLKLILKRIINTCDVVKDLLCSYYLKTALFWVSEEIDIDSFQLSKLFVCLFLCLNKLISWVTNCYCPNYFIPAHNMFLGKITPDNNYTLLQVLDSIVFGGLNGLIENVFPPQSETYRLLTTDNEISFVKLDFLFYRICGLVTETDVSSCYNMYTLLPFIESLLKSESSPFVVDACKYHYAKISQYAAQLLPTPTTKDVAKKDNMHKCYRRHLQDGIKTDAVSAWLLYASFYYVTGQYTVALRLIDYVLSRCTLDMVYIGFPSNEADIKSYRQLVHYSVSLEAKMKIATIDCVTYMEHSPFVPAELQFMVEKTMIGLPPVVMAHCLRFLSYHHLGDNFNRQQVLRDLYLTVKNRHFISMNEMSDSYTILGVCYEISGDKDTAYKYYNEASSILTL